MFSFARPSHGLSTSIVSIAALWLVIGAGLASIVASGGGTESEPDGGTPAPPPFSVFPQRYTFGGDMLPVSVVLASPVPAGSTATFTVSSTLPSGTVSSPTTLEIPAGGTELNFNLTTQAVGDFTDGRVDVTWENHAVGGVVSPITSGQPTTLMPEPTSIQLSFVPNAVPGGQPSTLRIDIAPVYPASVAVELSADSALVQVPPQLAINGGAASISRAIATDTTATATLVTVSARFRGVVDIESLLVNTTESGQLQLGIAVNGGGRVTSSPAGIDCTGECVASFNMGTVVTLTPQADAGQRFFGWGGDGDCSDGVVTLSSQRACTAIFNAPPAPPPSGSGWTQLGAALATASDVDPTPSLAMDFSSPVVAYVEALAGDVARLHVRRLEGTTWVALGGAALNAGSLAAASEPSLRLGSYGMPYLAWIQGDGLQQNLFVSRFDGAAWESVGAALPLNYTSGSTARSPSLAFDTQQQPMVAWVEDGAVRFKHFDGNAWVAASGGSGPASGVVDRVRLSSDAQGVPELAWTEGAAPNRLIRVARDFNFTPLGAQVNAAAPADRTAINHFGVLAYTGGGFVTWGQGVAPYDILVRRWNGNDWVDFGDNRIINNNPNQLVSLAIDRRSLAVAHSYFLTNADASTLIVSGYSAGSNSWQALTSPIADTRQAQIGSLSLEMPTANSPVIAGSQRNAQNLYEVRVRRFFPLAP